MSSAVQLSIPVTSFEENWQRQHVSCSLLDDRLNVLWCSCCWLLTPGHIAEVTHNCPLYKFVHYFPLFLDVHISSILFFLSVVGLHVFIELLRLFLVCFVQPTTFCMLVFGEPWRASTEIRSQVSRNDLMGHVNHYTTGNSNYDKWVSQAKKNSELGHAVCFLVISEPSRLILWEIGYFNRPACPHALNVLGDLE